MPTFDVKGIAKLVRANGDDIGPFFQIAGNIITQRMLVTSGFGDFLAIDVDARLVIRGDGQQSPRGRCG